MKNIFAALVLPLLFNLDASAQDKNIFSRYYKLIPEEEALKSIGTSVDSELKSTSIKALIWNIKKAQLKNWRSEFLKLGKSHDLFVIQEAYGNELFHSTLDSFHQFNWKMGISFLFPQDKNSPTGTMIGARVSPSEVIVKHSTDFEPVLSTPKALTFVKYPVEKRNTELLVISVHAINFQSTGAFKRHMEQAEGVIREHSGPVLFAGDFNTWNQTRTTFLFNLARKLGLAQVHFKNGQNRMKFGQYFLDHSFTRGIDVTKAEVILSNGSDHRPLLIEMNIL